VYIRHGKNLLPGTKITKHGWWIQARAGTKSIGIPHTVLPVFGILYHLSHGVSMSPNKDHPVYSPSY